MMRSSLPNRPPMPKRALFASRWPIQVLLALYAPVLACSGEAEPSNTSVLRQMLSDGALGSPDSSPATSDDAVVSDSPAYPGDELLRLHKPLAWDAEQHTVELPSCEGILDCEMSLPLGMPYSCLPRSPPVRNALSAQAALLAGCGFLGARHAVRMNARAEPVAREVWYDLDSGARVGMADKLPGLPVRLYGLAPSSECRLTVCDPCQMVYGGDLPGPRMSCDLADVGVDPAVTGEWSRRDLGIVE
jgi:hypothetical protein